MEEMDYRELLKNRKRIVVKIGSSSLSYPNGKINYSRLEQVAIALSKLQSEGRQMVLVSSGATAVGAGRMGITGKPSDKVEKQALAAIGQAGLIKIYQRFFDRHHQAVAQVLLTKDAITIPVRRRNARNTLDTLLGLNVIPIINENDTVSTEQIEFGDNDTLSAYVAELIDADLLMILSDIDGLYSGDPHNNPEAKIISLVTEFSPWLENIASGSASSFGTGGMVTKIMAARICWEAGIDAVIASGEDPFVLFRLLKGELLGTLFAFGSRMTVC
ncbi:MAG TPA: glutamate 5-kinase [Bacteroidales bacterium]|nr:glutamate 5-kinase [Bacteroidales bacterium]